MALFILKRAILSLLLMTAVSCTHNDDEMEQIAEIVLKKNEGVNIRVTPVPLDKTDK